MNILLLDGSNDSDSDYGIKRFTAEAKGSGIKSSTCIHISDICLANGEIFVGQRPLPQSYDLVLPRPEFTQHDWASVIRAFEAGGSVCVNDSRGFASVADKWTMAQRFIAAGVPHPETYLLDDDTERTRTLAGELGYPCVLKLAMGTQGIGVELCHNVRDLDAKVADLGRDHPGNPLLLQKFVKSSHGRDVRAFVVGDRCVAAMLREAADPAEFRSNASLGGKGSEFKIPEKWAALAIAAVHATGLHYGGVDMLFDANGEAIICEVNKSPGFKALEKAFPKLNVPRVVLGHAADVVARRNPHPRASVAVSSPAPGLS